MSKKQFIAAFIGLLLIFGAIFYIAKYKNSSDTVSIEYLDEINNEKHIKGKKTSEKKETKPDSIDNAFVEKFTNKYLKTIKNEDFDKSYTYLWQPSLEIMDMTLDLYKKQMKSDLLNTNRRYESFRIMQIKDYNKNTKIISLMVNLVENKEKRVNEDTLVLKLDKEGHWKVSYLGIVDGLAWKTDKAPTSGLVIYPRSYIETSVGATVRYKITNFTSREYQFGVNGPGTITLETSKGKYEGHIGYKIGTKANIKQNVYFEGAKGTPKRMILKNLYTVEKNNNIKQYKNSIVLWSGNKI